MQDVDLFRDDQVFKIEQLRIFEVNLVSASGPNLASLTDISVVFNILAFNAIKMIPFIAVIALHHLLIIEGLPTNAKQSMIFHVYLAVAFNFI